MTWQDENRSRVHHSTVGHSIHSQSGAIVAGCPLCEDRYTDPEDYRTQEDEDRAMTDVPAPNFGYQDMSEDNGREAIAAAIERQLVAITSETDGGIVAYAIGLDHATALVRALNAAEGEYEAELVATIANGNGAGDAAP
jgi:hypothetical protein